MKKLLKSKINLLLSIVLILISIGGTWCATYFAARPEEESKVSEKTAEQLYADAVKDAMTIEPEEILPLVRLDKGQQYATFDKNGRVLLLTFHKYPDSYPNGKEVTLEWGEVWTFTAGELADWYKDNSSKVTDWPSRLRQLIGLAPDNQADHFTAMWVNPEDVVRPANVQDIKSDKMTAELDEKTDEDFYDWFDDNILYSYFESDYPWTRLGYTYDWAADAEDEYGLSEFLVKKDSKVQVGYTVTTDEMLKLLENGSWLPDAPGSLSNAA